MRQRLRNRYRLSDGKRAQALAYFLVAVVGLGMGYLNVVRLADGRPLIEGFSWYERWIVLCAGLGAVTALFLSGDRMGQGGPWSAARALAGAIWVSIVGAIIAGTLALPLYGTMFAPFSLVITLATSPVIALIWAAHLLGIHILLGIFQRERDSIFTTERMTYRDHPDHLRTRMMGRFL